MNDRVVIKVNTESKVNILPLSKFFLGWEFPLLLLPCILQYPSIQPLSSSLSSDNCLCSSITFILYWFVFFFFWLYQVAYWDLSSPTRDLTHAFGSEKCRNLTTGLPEKWSQNVHYLRISLTTPIYLLLHVVLEKLFFVFVFCFFFPHSFQFCSARKISCAQVGAVQ